ncbi:ATP-binding protein [Streptomyces sp. col6]|uniref:ATP-binding protein n=1 Tax=Streptomyces sp. col6 TaxID=2478958 RepID=UPI001CD159CB|nr:ATP-binding protein [Streptomyces sp. col6]
MSPFRLDNTLPVGTTIPAPSLIALIGAAGSGKSTWASTWPSTQVLELDRFRAMVSDEAGDQSATLSAVNVMHTVLKARLARKRTTLIDATNTEARVRAGLVRMAQDNGVPTVALVVPTPVSVCLERQAHRSPDRAVPEHVVRRQHADMTAARAKRASITSCSPTPPGRTQRRRRTGRATSPSSEPGSPNWRPGRTSSQEKTPDGSSTGSRRRTGTWRSCTTASTTPEA